MGDANCMTKKKNDQEERKK